MTLIVRNEKEHCNFKLSGENIMPPRNPSDLRHTLSARRPQTVSTHAPVTSSSTRQREPAPSMSREDYFQELLSLTIQQAAAAKAKHKEELSALSRKRSHEVDDTFNADNAKRLKDENSALEIQLAGLREEHETLARGYNLLKIRHETLSTEHQDLIKSKEDLSKKLLDKDRILQIASKKIKSFKEKETISTKQHATDIQKRDHKIAELNSRLLQAQKEITELKAHAFTIDKKSDLVEVLSNEKIETILPQEINPGKDIRSILNAYKSKKLPNPAQRLEDFVPIPLSENPAYPMITNLDSSSDTRSTTTCHSTVVNVHALNVQKQRYYPK